MRRLVVAVSKAGINLLYAIMCAVHRRGNRALFLSRQTEEPSYDFRALAREFEKRDWKTRMHLKKVSKRNLPSYVIHVIKEIDLLSQAKVVLLDRYDPIISLVRFKSESHPGLSPSQSKHIHTDYPVEPVVIQIWHAFGAFKKFGYQSVGTREGHSEEVTDTFNIHRNYSWIICSGEHCRESFAEAFSYPTSRILPMNRPEFDELREIGNRTTPESNASGKPLLLFAPTLRKSKASRHPFRDLYRNRESFEREVKGAISWSFHPLEDGLSAPGNVSDMLLEADALVTDYSSIVYEAYLLGKPVFFYVPDIDVYRKSPGLNSDPLEIAPHLCARSHEELAELLNRHCGNPSTYPSEELALFAQTAFDEPTGEIAPQLVEFCIEASEHARLPLTSEQQAENVPETPLAENLF